MNTIWISSYFNNDLKGGAGFIGPILEWDLWSVISKLSYSMYLLHPLLLDLSYTGQFIVPVHLSDLKPFILYLGFLMMTMFMSILFYVGIEAPLMSLEKMVMGWIYDDC